jgi:hypothetical protein
MRLALALALLASPAAAWEFRADPVCTLRHEGPDAVVEITRDPGVPEPYAITLTRPEPWPSAPRFAIRYEGPRGFTITTGRHTRSADGRTLRVTDTGFGNVLDGLEQGGRAIALSGDAAVAVDLTGAAPAVRAFRACPAPPLS